MQPLLGRPDVVDLNNVRVLELRRRASLTDAMDAAVAANAASFANLMDAYAPRVDDGDWDRAAPRRGGWRAQALTTMDMFARQTQGTYVCLLYTSPSPRDGLLSRMPSSA